MEGLKQQHLQSQWSPSHVEHNIYIVGVLISGNFLNYVLIDSVLIEGFHMQVVSTVTVFNDVIMTSS